MTLETRAGKKLNFVFPGDRQGLQALMAYLGSQGDAGVLFYVIDNAAAAGVEGAEDLATAIRQAAHKAGVR
jgi:hypothetical protein